MDLGTLTAALVFYFAFPNCSQLILQQLFLSLKVKRTSSGFQR
jgi:hypothetical protein